MIDITVGIIMLLLYSFIGTILYIFTSNEYILAWWGIGPLGWIIYFVQKMNFKRKGKKNFDGE